jgi:hypothetical protein
MYLAGIPVYTIMLLGRWSSDAFLHYIRKQVKKFSKGISEKMIQNENFFTIPSGPNQDTGKPIHPLNHASCNKNGLCFKGMITPLVSVFQ